MMTPSALEYTLKRTSGWCGRDLQVAVPIICRPRPARRDARPPGPVRTTAVVVVYFERPLRASASSISKVTLTFLESRFFLQSDSEGILPLDWPIFPFEAKFHR